MDDRVAIRAEGLTKYYGKVHALEDLNLEIHAGEVFGFLGPNGAGKTTTIRTMMDEIRPTAGRAEILGMDTHEKSVDIRKRIGYLPGDLAMYPNLTGQDMITYFANLRHGVDKDHVEKLRERFEAELSMKVGDLSSGNRQKVGLILALMSKPDVLMFDEPSTGLDPIIQRELQKVMRETADQGCTVFLSSHTLSEVQRVADRVGIIRHGRLVTVESVAALRSKGVRRVELELDRPADAAIFEAVSGVRDVSVANNHVVMSFEGEVGTVLKVATQHYTVVDINSQEADLEEIFLTYYRDEATPAEVAS
jgi:ABC-2 type transport system ATP-binding protein